MVDSFSSSWPTTSSLPRVFLHQDLTWEDGSTNELHCFLLFVCLGLTSFLNIWGHITTVPACSSGTLTNVLPHRNAMPQTQDTTVTSRCVRRSVMSACGHNGTPGTSRSVRRSVISAMDFHRSVVSACGHNGTTGTSRYVRRSVMSADNFRDSLYLEYTPSKTYFNTWFIKIKYGLDVYMTNFWFARR